MSNRIRMLFKIQRMRLDVVRLVTAINETGDPQQRLELLNELRESLIRLEATLSMVSAGESR